MRVSVSICQKVYVYIENKDMHTFVFFCVGIVCQDNEKRTPLHAAAYLGDAEIIELLILSGNPNIPAVHLHNWIIHMNWPESVGNTTNKIHISAIVLKITPRNWLAKQRSTPSFTIVRKENTESNTQRVDRIGILECVMYDTFPVWIWRVFDIVLGTLQFQSRLTQPWCWLLVSPDMSCNKWRTPHWCRQG